MEVGRRCKETDDARTELLNEELKDHLETRSRARDTHVWMSTLHASTSFLLLNLKFNRAQIKDDDI